MFSSDRWRHKGHPLGQCSISPDGDFAFMYIPKNSSSYWDTWLERLGWTKHFNCTKIGNAKPIIALRDVEDRWLTGISEYFMLYHQEQFENYTNTPGFEKLVEDRVVFDDHTECQTYFFQQIDLRNAVYYKSDNVQGIWYLLEQHGYDIPKVHWRDERINFTEDPVNADRKAWKKYFQEKIDLNNIRNYYEIHDKFTIDKLRQIDEQ